jgi:ABC-type Fe3+-hydroxamate transport system substrate-binding protein
MILTDSSALSHPPKRIISLVPSQTELLYDLGLDEQVCGISKFCIHPSSWFKTKQRVGGTKNPNLELINSLNPDLIIANHEENRKEDIEDLAAHFNIWVTDVKSIEDALQMIKDLGRLTHTEERARHICHEIESARKWKDKALEDARPIPTAYLIWKNPYMTVGADSFIHAMLAEAKLENVFADQLRYPETNLDNDNVDRAELILLSTEPYPFSADDVAHLSEIFPDKKIMLADGEIFSWYGSRLRLAMPHISEFRKQMERWPAG